MRELKVGDKVFVCGTYIGTGREGFPVVDFAPPYPSRLSLLPESIVPASAVPTEEHRAAVGRVTDVVALSLRAKRMWLEGSVTALEIQNLQDDTATAIGAIQDGDIEAARAVAEGGTNG